MAVGWPWQSEVCAVATRRGDRLFMQVEERRDVRLSRQRAEARAVWIVGTLAKSQLGREVLGSFMSRFEFGPRIYFHYVLYLFYRVFESFRIK